MKFQPNGVLNQLIQFRALTYWPLVAGLATAMSFWLGPLGCDVPSGPEAEAPSTQGASAEAATPRIAILQASPQAWADALKLGFVDGLEAEGFKQGDEVVIVYRSAAGDPAGLNTLAEVVARSNFAIVYTLGTQASQAYFNVMGPGNMVFGAVTDPKEAGFYNKQSGKPLKNLTGSQDLWPYPAQFRLIRELLPQADEIGIPYNPKEVNTVTSMVSVRAEANKVGLRIAEKEVILPNEVEPAVGALLANGVDAIYIPADNTIQGNASSVINLSTEKQIPVFTGISGIVELGALGTVGTDYYQVGKVNGRQAAQILRGASAKDIPPAIADEGELYLNQTAADQLRISLPEALKRQAAKVYGEKTTP